MNTLIVIMDRRNLAGFRIGPLSRLKKYHAGEARMMTATKKVKGRSWGK
jgi:hypothetical protein